MQVLGHIVDAVIGLSFLDSKRGGFIRGRHWSEEQAPPRETNQSDEINYSGHRHTALTARGNVWQSARDCQQLGHLYSCMALRGAGVSAKPGSACKLPDGNAAS